MKKLLVTTILSATLSLSAFAATVPAGVTLSADQDLTYRVLDEYESIDPQMMESVDAASLARDLFEGLYNQDAEGNLVPGVATHHDVSDDKMTYTFHLRDNAKWSDGNPVTAQDFVYGWQRAADPANASPYAWFIELMSIENGAAVIAGEVSVDQLGVSALDAHTFQVKLSQPLPYFAQMVTQATVFPAPKWAIDAHGASWVEPGKMVSNGAYVLSEHVAKERLKRVRNEHYWDNANTVINSVTSLVINDVNTALTRFRAGEFDLMDELPSGQYPNLKAELPDQIFSVPHLCSYYYVINLTDTGNPALQDKRVRQALSLSIDRDIIVENVLKAGQYPAYNFTPLATAGFVAPEMAAAQMTQAERNAQAKALMAEAGVNSKDVNVQLLYNTSEAHKQIAVVISQMWKENLGITTTLENQEWQVYLENRSNQNYQVARAGWCGDYNEASTFLDLVATNSGYNDSKYSNAEVDELLAKSKTAADPNPNYTRIEQIISDEVPLIPIYHYTHNLAINPKLKGWPFDNVQQKWYSKDLYFVE